MTAVSGPRVEVPLLGVHASKDDLKRRAPIVSVAHALGIRVGSDGRAICPFHDDHSPSFTVWVDPAGVQRWGCFPCGLSGDAFDLVQRTRSCGFGEAMRFVAEIAESSPPDFPPPVQKVDLDFESLVAFINASQERAALEESDGWLSVAAGFTDYRERVTDSWLRWAGWGADENGNVVIPYWDLDLRPSGAKIRSIDGYRWAFPGSRFTSFYGQWVSKNRETALLMVEGETDYMCAMMQKPDWLRVLSLPTGAGRIEHTWVLDTASEYGRVYLGFDSDDAGRTATRRWSEFHARMHSIDWHGDSRLFALPIPEDHDLRDCGSPLSELLRDAEEMNAD